VLVPDGRKFITTISFISEDGIIRRNKQNMNSGARQGYFQIIALDLESNLD
jgi:hypothetical protein